MSYHKTTAKIGFSGTSRADLKNSALYASLKRVFYKSITQQSKTFKTHEEI